jgi:peptide/nickel transport system permease protein
MDNFGIPAALQVVVLSTVLSVLGGALGDGERIFGRKVRSGHSVCNGYYLHYQVYCYQITLSFVLGRGVLNAAIALAINIHSPAYRVVRNQTISVKTKFILKRRRQWSASTWRILLKVLLLNVIQVYL